jgi:hypothetical protein
MMYFTQIKEDIVIDQIPLAEIIQVKEMEAGKEINEAQDDKQLMIETHPEGYNSGRTYYLQADSKSACQDKIKLLEHHKAAAYEREHAQSVFRQAQLRVLKVYRSTVFQRFIAFLIIVVRALYFFQIMTSLNTDSPFDRTLLSAFWMRS